MSKVSFNTSFWGYDKKIVEQALANHLQDVENNSVDIVFNTVTAEYNRLKSVHDFLTAQLNASENITEIMLKSTSYSNDFTDYLKVKAQAKACAILKEATEYAREQEAAVANVAKEIAEIEETLVKLQRDTSRILESMTGKNIACASTISIDCATMTDLEIVKPNANTAVSNVPPTISVSPANDSYSAENSTPSNIDDTTDIPLQIPLQDDTLAHTVTATVDEKPSPDASSSNCILIIEDDRIVERLLTFFLEKEGFVIAVARDGREATQFIDKMSPPSLVLLDTMLPYAGGLQLLKHIRSTKEWAKIPVIMLVPFSTERDIESAMKFGANDYLNKPFNPNELLAKIHSFIPIKRLAGLS